MYKSDKIMTFLRFHLSIKTPVKSPKIKCGNIDASVEYARTSADFVRMLNQNIMA